MPDRCTYISQGGVRCCRYSSLKTKKTLCLRHAPPVNKECPVCLEDTGRPDKWISFPCVHRCHINCIKGLIKEECPLCRKKLSSLPKDIRRMIAVNKAQYKQEMEEDSIRMFVDNTANFEGNRPEIEALMALQYLVENGLPLNIMPSGIRIEDSEILNSLPEGMICNLIVTRLVSFLEEKLDNMEEAEEDDTEDDIRMEHIEDDYRGRDVREYIIETFFRNEIDR